MTRLSNRLLSILTAAGLAAAIVPVAACAQGQRHEHPPGGTDKQTPAKTEAKTEAKAAAKAVAKPVPKSVALTDAIKNLGVAMLAQQVAADPRRTHIVSPLSLGGALGLLAQGASGKTAQTILPALGNPPDGAEGVAKSWKEMADVLRKPASDTVTLQLANGLWHAAALTVDEAVAGRIRDALSGEIAAIDPAKGDPAAAVNAWVADKTAGAIPSVVERLGPDTELVLASALAFKGRWETSFDPSATMPRPFKAADGTKPEVPMMARVDDAFRYAETKDSRGVLLPYADPAYAMIAVLPKTPEKLPGLLRNGDWLKPERYARRKGRVLLPRLDLAAGSDLRDTKANPAVAKLLSGGLDLGALGAAWAKPHKVGQALQRVVLKVDESGTTAAAATVIGIEKSMSVTPQETPFELIFDRPFALALIHRETGALLLAGVVAKP
ncbi:serpin B [Azospirillum agricola]|uniref:serpin family protein n=1 Tax=Azospirillum agricola TaxID=1720247 RepID=UPI001AE77C91|nr:serpin family protein [Azospirillum agricola]MBP2230036.1 serpin B [Azospirillum agricola]